MPAARKAWPAAPLMLVIAVVLTGCGLFKQQMLYEELGRNEHVAVIGLRQDSSFEALADHFYNDRGKAWRIAEANDGATAARDQIVVVPLKPYFRGGVFPDGLQEVAILCYHRFARTEEAAHSLIVTERDFRAQLDYLQANDYTVIPFRRMLDFLEGKASLPPRSVVLTIDDGFASVYDIAYPILREYGTPATVFIYHDLIGGGAAMSWKEVADMAADPLISIQSHSKSHANLNLRLEAESDSAYRARLRREIDTPLKKLAKLENDPQFVFSFPYGEGNALLVELLKARGYRLAATVNRGGNSSVADPYMLQRTMIYGQDSLETFSRKLDIFQQRRP